ncbi:MAG: suppressor of fused domain protein [Leptospiraceae bacterium]|nr:suppressor of fused domain protein [Leptospiraceae bacterium]MCP5493706.1 suppressor of fused domain protein [Leptospiraceae bacterium]
MQIHNYEPKVIYQETNPYGSLTAFLEDDGRTVYMYLQSEHNPEWTMKSVWIKNRIQAPTKMSMDDAKDGLAPILSSEYVEQSDEAQITPEGIYFIWTEEGDGVALFVKEELYAFIPPWSGIGGFHGYSKFVQKEALTAFPLGDSNHGVISDRVNEARKFWEFRANKDSWKMIQGNLLHFLESKFGSHTKYWSADGGKFPYIGIAKFLPVSYPDVIIYSTIGISGQNMPQVELYHRDRYLDYARVELVIAIRTKENQGNTEKWIPHLIGEIVHFPWKMLQWYGNGHTVSMSRKDPEGLLEFTTLLLLDNPPSITQENQQMEIPVLTELRSKEGRPIHFLFALPITEEEKLFIQENGLQKFTELWVEKGNDWIHNSQRTSIV